MHESRATQKLRRRADEKKQTLPELAEDIGVPFATLSGWIFHGKLPKPGTVTNLAASGIVEPGDWYAAADGAAHEGVQAAE